MKTVVILASFAVLSFFGTSSNAFAQAMPPPTPSLTQPAFLWKSDHAKHLIGLPDIKENTDGTLALSPTEFVFTTPSGQTILQRTQIAAVSFGDERMETGGKIGKLGRMAIPYGGGSALALMTKAKVDLLTIEYRDTNDAYHGVVFLLPKNEVAGLRDMIPLSELHKAVEEPRPPCISGAIQPETLKVSTISVVGIPLPTEYKVLIYEKLMHRLQADAGPGHVFRDGDRSPAAACPAVNLTLSVNAFSKGNAILRASTGPLGEFMGTTSLKFHVLIQDYQGKVVLEKDLKSSQRGDSESLGVANSIAKTITKKFEKAKRKQTLA
jgi:hypothetical protein